MHVENFNHISNYKDADNTMLIDLNTNSESQTNQCDSPNPTSDNTRIGNSVIVDLSTHSVDKRLKTYIENISVQASNNPPSTQTPAQTTKRPASSTFSTSPSINTSNVNNLINSSTSQINTQIQKSKKGTLKAKLLDSAKIPQPLSKKPKRLIHWNRSY